MEHEMTLKVIKPFNVTDAYRQEAKSLHTRLYYSALMLVSHSELNSLETLVNNQHMILLGGTFRAITGITRSNDKLTIELNKVPYQFKKLPIEAKVEIISLLDKLN